MAEITLEGKSYPVKFTTYTAKLMNDLTGINLYDLTDIAQIFGDDDEGKTKSMSVHQFETFCKFLYAAMAAGALPEDADETWKPPFTVTSLMNKMNINDASIITELTAAYLNIPLDDFKALSQKNASAPLTAGPIASE